MNPFNTLHSAVFGFEKDGDKTLINAAGVELMNWLKDEQHDVNSRPEMPKDFMDKFFGEFEPDEVLQRLEEIGIDGLYYKEQRHFDEFTSEFEREMAEAEQDERDLHSEFNHMVYSSLRR